ncbi:MULTISPECIES: hypothetical protein [Nocardia]|jgi:hypothetical protein|uniref:Uncharacterized protein n=1 Tax=Nocardia elegans TaxID=300029 RepID=A0ABW6TC91_9NOCA|nr:MULTISPECIES: hypothetical protein [Nocardia]MBF6147453.1 hypothetical protein [Nocardia nova]MBF6244418.1 hypothetical protein [Nocardia elegans]MBF6447924.1 hypothetical protein [Nocardia elegans]
MNGWALLGLVVCIGLPLSVLIATLIVPQRIPKDRKVDVIRRRIENEDR